MQVLCLQGPNLNLLGHREPDTYGSVTLEGIQRELDGLAKDLGVELRHVQSNHEGGLIDAIQAAAAEGFAGCVINPGGYTHSSVAVRDAFSATKLPFVEVHISNVHAREPFRHTSLFAPIARGVVIGFGPAGYRLALQGLVERVRREG